MVSVEVSDEEIVVIWSTCQCIRGLLSSDVHRRAINLESFGKLGS